MWLLIFFLFPCLLTSSPFAYVTQKTPGIVDTFDTSTHRVGRSIPVGESPQALAISPDGNYLFVVNTASDSVSVVDITTGKHVESMFIDDPAGIALAPDGRRGYIVSHDGLYEFDVDRKQVERRILKIMGYGSRKLLLSSDGKKAYIALADAIACIDLEEEVSVYLRLEGNFEGMALTPDGSMLCAVSTTLPYSFLLIDTEKKTLIKNIPLQGIAHRARSIVMTHDGSAAYVLGESTGNIVPIFLPTGQVGESISVGVFPKDAAITPDGSMIYVANFISDDITPVEVASHKAKQPIPLRDECSGIVIAPYSLVENLQGWQKKSSFLSADSFTNYISWSKPKKSHTKAFEILKNGTFFRRVPAEGPLEVEDRRIRKGAKITYSVVAISASGTKSKPAIIEVP